MKPKPQPTDAFQLFQAHFKQILNREHPLIQLADRIDWPRFDAAFADCYSEDLGAPAKATRLMVGLAYLKYTFDESDESVVARWVENLYWQYFCGFTHMQHEAPIDPSSLSRWRKRVGAERLALLLKETVELAVREKHLPKQDLRQVTVDITYPTDSKLLYTAIGKLGRAARAYGVTLRQSYIRVGKHAATKVSRYAHAKQFRRMRRELRRLRTWVGRLIRDIRRKAGEVPEDLEEILARAEWIRQQQPSDSHRLYSWHEPQVQCLSKGQGPPAVRVRPEGGGGDDEPQQLDRGGQVAGEQSVRRAHAGRDPGGSRVDHRRGDCRRVRGQGVPWPRLSRFDGGPYCRDAFKAPSPQ
ncbi:MAG: IS5 family transposase [Phycisphaerae bacterium]|jgi:IS5 family transposase